jgi:phosphatidylinositol phospholipase C delta
LKRRRKERKNIVFIFLISVDSNPAVIKNHLDIKRNLSVIKETEEYEFSKRGTFNMDTERISFAAKTLSSNKLADTKTIKSKEVVVNDNNISIIQEEKTKEEQEKIAKESIKNKKKTIKEVVPDLYDLIGLISVHMKIEDLTGANYQPWDVVSLSEGKINKYLKSDKQRLLEFTSNSFLRVYPIGTRFDSSNYDPVKSWICGGQLVSLNLQSLSDDYTLLNHLFFKLNNERGYILKPPYLRSGTCKNREIFSPIFILHFDILSGIMLQKCLKDSSKEILVTVSVIGTFEDDKNAVLKTDIVKENFLHPKFSNGGGKFFIFEENLSFLLIKVIDNDSCVLARSIVPMMSIMEGYRNIHLYDGQCHEIENSILIVKVKKVV